MNDTLMTVLGIFLLAGAFLAYKWTYSYTVFNETRRRNQQFALVTVLTVTGAVLLCLGRGVI